MFSYVTEENREVIFANEDAYETAMDWYNRTSKKECMAYYAERMQDGAIWADADCTKLAGDWADLCMAAYAAGTAGGCGAVWRNSI